jgi:hypothetical protein
VWFKVRSGVTATNTNLVVFLFFIFSVPLSLSLSLSFSLYSLLNTPWWTFEPEKVSVTPDSGEFWVVFSLFLYTKDSCERSVLLSSFQSGSLLALTVSLEVHETRVKQTE